MVVQFKRKHIKILSGPIIKDLPYKNGIRIFTTTAGDSGGSAQNNHAIRALVFDNPIGLFQKNGILLFMALPTFWRTKTARFGIDFPVFDSILKPFDCLAKRPFVCIIIDTGRSYAALSPHP